MRGAEIDGIVGLGERLSFTRDRFQRTLCAHAVVARTALVTADRIIRTRRPTRFDPVALI